MKGYISVEIPVKPYSKAYINHQLRGRPLIIRRGGHSIEIKLYDLIERSVQYKYCDECTLPNIVSSRPTNEYRTKSNVENYKERVQAYISIHDFKRAGSELNETKLRNFNAYIEKKIKERFCELMDDAVDILPVFEAHLPDIRRRMGIDIDHWPDDSMKKVYYRYRLRENKPLLYSKIKYNNGRPRIADLIWK